MHVNTTIQGKRKLEPVCSGFISQYVYKTRNKLVKRVTSHDIYMEGKTSSQITSHTNKNKLCCVLCIVMHNNINIIILLIRCIIVNYYTSHLYVISQV